MRKHIQRFLAAALASLFAFAVSIACAVRPALAGPRISYRTHVQDVGWQGYVENGATAGTEGRSLRLESITIKLDNIEGGIQYRTHVQDIGWTSWSTSGKDSGSTGQSLRLEGIQIKLTGTAAELFDIEYRTHVQDIGWQDWVKNGALSGTTGRSLRLEAIQIRLVPKMSGTVFYRTHVQDVGWQGWVADGATAGTSGRSLRVEALQIALSPDVSGYVSYSAHVQDVGWQNSVTNGVIAGTSGRSLRVEALKISLGGEIAQTHDIYYRVHVQDFGWLDWAKNGEIAGTMGRSKRVEALQIMIVPKGSVAPSNSGSAGSNDTSPAAPSAPASGTPIMGTPTRTASQLAAHYRSHSLHPYPVFYAQHGVPTIDEFCQILYEEAVAEGVRPEVAYAQAMLETGYLGFGHDVKIEQFNFGGLGATGGGEPGNSFPDVRTGLRALVQHLKAYASTNPLVNECVDLRFGYVTRGIAPYVEDLSGKWAVGSDYADKVKSILEGI